VIFTFHHNRLSVANHAWSDRFFNHLLFSNGKPPSPVQSYEPAIAVSDLAVAFNFYTTAEMLERNFNIKLQARTGSWDDSKTATKMTAL